METPQRHLTNVEWPKENQVPTVTGRWPDAIKRLVMRSIACQRKRLNRQRQ